MASRLEFRILGPLAVSVDGVDIPIGGPKQRALLALLLLSANRVVARERLIDELFADQSVNSADHALRNHVSRLRKVLGPAARDEPRLVARSPGYLLRVEPGELDLERFERLVADARDALAGADAATAAASLRAAEGLWEGRPFADLELEPFAGVEVERLEELRLAAVEERIDAELVLGRQRALVPELEALTVEHPYRERFRAQLMLAMYRAGRQADGLEVYRRTRTLLQEELGLEPGVELQELQRAILVQDPALALPADAALQRRRQRRDLCPFKGLAPFDESDAELFFGRERLVDELVSRLRDTPFLAVVGASGSGKSSLLRAGLVPALGRVSTVVRPDEPLPTAGATDVLAVDQFEELFAPSVAEEARRAFVDTLVDIAWDPDRRTAVLLALRADFFGHLARYPELADLVGPNSVLLGPMTRGELRRAIEGPAERVGLDVEEDLVDALVDDVAREPGALPLLSTSLLDLWRERDGDSLTLDAYHRSGGVHRAVARHAETAFRSLEELDRPVAKRILLRLVAGGEGEALTRRRVPLVELDGDDARIRRVVEVLVAERLLVAGESTVELVHEALLDHWPRLTAWLEEDAQGRRVHLHLAQAACEWAAAGRDPGELYRGARLAAALEWSDAAVLNRVEREFLDESRDAHARATRRLRSLLGTTLLLLVLALVAGVVALVARGSAKRQATAAIAQRLGAQALAEPRIDRALLLAREGVRLDDSPATRSNLLATLLRSPAALAVLHGPDPQVLDDALSADGRLLAIRGNNGDVTFFDTRSLRPRGPAFRGVGGLTYCGAVARPVRALAFSPDGGVLAVGDFDGNRSMLYLLDAGTHRARAALKERRGATDDVVYAPDGGSLVTAATTTCARSAPPERLTVRQVGDGAPLLRSRPIRGGRIIGFVHAGRWLLITEGDTASYLLDARSLARVRTFPLSGTAAVSPTADTAVFGEDDGSVDLVDLRTGAVEPMDRRATGHVIGAAFSRDGNVVATTSDDGSVAVWDVPTRRLRETFAGHAAAAVAPVFSPDGATLYTASDDGTVIVWDVFGARRLGRPFRFAPSAAGGEGLHVPGDGAGAVATAPDSSRFVTSPAPDHVTLWRARDLTALVDLRGPCGEVESLVFSHDGRLVACAGGGDTVIWSERTRQLLAVLAPRRNDGVNFSPDDRLLAAAAQDGKVRLYAVPSGRLVATLKAKGTMNDVDFSADGARVVATGLAGTIFVWNVGTHVLERSIVHHDALISIRLSPDGRQIATGDLKGNLDLWDVASGAHLGTLGGQNGYVGSVTWSPDGRDLMTTSTDGKFRIWDVATRKLVGAPLPGDAVGGWGTYFPNGKEIVAAFGTGKGVVWNVDPAAWNRAACRIAHRNLTRAEWHQFLPERRYASVC
jgi:WD40 repeat protein/DNA-binding SARP family transcriptional activator